MAKSTTQNLMALKVRVAQKRRTMKLLLQFEKEVELWQPGNPMSRYALDMDERMSLSEEIAAGIALLEKKISKIEL